ncbi:MAG: peptidoglycan DD-metalloendopeptidase family protein [Pseudomonadota bacterium]
MPEWALYPPRLAVGQAGLLSIREPEGVWVTGFFLGKTVNFQKTGGILRAILPADLFSSPGTYPLTLSFEQIDNGTLHSEDVGIEVEPYSFPVEGLELPEHMVTLPPDVQERVESEKKQIESILNMMPREELWQDGFLKPVDGNVSGLFGSRRIMNGKERSRHLGVDIGGKEGDPVFSSNKGRIALIGDFYLTGKTVIVDHGQGVFTIYCHLSKVFAEEEAKIGRGEILGEVGSTGRSTGPHLHWGARVCGARVDPLSLVQSTAGFASASFAPLR